MLFTVVDICWGYALVRYTDPGVESEVALVLLPFWAGIGDSLKVENYEFSRV